MDIIQMDNCEQPNLPQPSAAFRDLFRGEIYLVDYLSDLALRFHEFNVAESAPGNFRLFLELEMDRLIQLENRATSRQRRRRQRQRLARSARRRN